MTETSLAQPIARLGLTGGIHVYAPDSLDVITTYVLREQGDWFEDEIKFLRNLLRPGQKAIDVGANYGVYTLTMARLVGPTGCVWAFEPASGTAGLLAESITANNFTQVVLEQAALSSMNGVAKLSLNDSPELNALVHDNNHAGLTETVPVTTLDDYMEQHNLRDIDFLKLDAEGEEAGILLGGARLFSVESPLVQFEVKAGKDIHLELLQEFSRIGYSSYRLVPGLGLLVPFSQEESVDNYLLNLFCCKPDRAAKLVRQGLLVDAQAKSRCEEVQSGMAVGKTGTIQADDWLATLRKLPYGKICAEQWKKMIAAGQCDEVESALSRYFMSQSQSLTPVERFSALRASFTQLMNLCETRPGYLRLASLARVARDYGARSIAVKALEELCNIIFQQRMVNTAEPFLSPGERFDHVSPQGSMENWIGAAVLEELERNIAFSSFFTGLHARQRLLAIRNLGFGSDEMSRRLSMVEQRFSASRL